MRSSATDGKWAVQHKPWCIYTPSPKSQVYKRKDSSHCHKSHWTKIFRPLCHTTGGVSIVYFFYFFTLLSWTTLLYTSRRSKSFFGSSKVNGSLGIGISSRVVSSTRTGNSKNAPLVFFWCCFVRAVEWYIYVYIKEGGRIFLFQFLFPYNLLIGRR